MVQTLTPRPQPFTFYLRMAKQESQMLGCFGKNALLPRDLAAMTMTGLCALSILLQADSTAYLAISHLSRIRYVLPVR